MTVSISTKAVLRYGFEVKLSRVAKDNYELLHGGLLALAYREIARRIKAGILYGDFEFKLTDHTAPRVFPRYGACDEYRVEVSG